MKKCPDCKSDMEELTAKTPEGVSYHYFKCRKCGEEIVDMRQLHDVAKKYREMKTFRAKMSRWGMSLGVRIPKELVSKYHFKDNEEVMIIPDDNGIKIIPV